jgi:protein tyrosine phosphatase (PTP) superfamily phosphohydrolase (DUF442 family)
MGRQTKTNLKRGAKVMLALVLFIALSVGGFVWHLFAHHNFHIVSDGLIYRSGQMNAESLSQVIHEKNIKSILNLRGEGGDQDWYKAETSTARGLGVKHYDFALSASREVQNEEIDRILGTIQRAPKPLLIHCKNGCDRTGLIGALYLYSVEGKSAEQAGHELSLFYGHVPYLFWRDTIAMDRSFWRYVHNHENLPNTAGKPVNSRDASAVVAHKPADAVAH